MLHPPNNLLHVGHSSHPDTGFKFEGLVIPKWKDIKSEVLDGAEATC